MKQIETQGRCEYVKLFDIKADTEKLCFETVGKDAAGRLILHRSETNSSDGGMADEYFVLTTAEYVELAAKARRDKLISHWALKRLLKELPLPAPPQDRIESVQHVLLRESGMRGIVEREILIDGGSAEISSYLIRYNGEKDERVLQQRAVHPAEDVIRLLNDCGVFAWTGFHGAHPRGLLDGIMFRFEAAVNGGQTIRADGSANFPKHYRDFTDGLYCMLNETES